MKRFYSIPAIAICAPLVMAVAQAQAPSSRKIPFNAVVTTMTCAPDPSLARTLQEQQTKLQAIELRLERRAAQGTAEVKGRR